METKIIGFCVSCKFRDSDGICTNGKLDESHNYSGEQKKDMLIYSYTEGGTFWVGERFGCIHFTNKYISLEDIERIKIEGPEAVLGKPDYEI